MDTYKISWKAYGKSTYTDITRQCSSIKWKLSADNCYAELSFSVPHDLRVPTLTEYALTAGDEVNLKNTKTGKMIFTGKIIKVGFDGSISCKDAGFYLKNPIYLHASKKRADKIIKSICSKAGVSCGAVSISTTLTESWAGTSATNCLEDVLADLETKTSKKRWIRFVDGKLTVPIFQTNVHTIRVTRNGAEGAFDCTKAVSDISGSISMESYVNFVNAIKNANSKTKKYARAQYTEGVKHYGKLIEYVTTESKAEAASTAKKALFADAQLDRDYKCTVFASDDLVPGVRLKFDGTESTDIQGEFWVTEADHELGQIHTASITLQRCKADYVKSTVKTMNTTIATESGNSSSGSATVVYTGRTVPALYTAYYPGPGIEGGYKDCMGNNLRATYLNKGILECAAPKSVKLKSRIQVEGTGTSKDGKVYLVADRGGAITVRNGRYHFDLLMSNASQANAWGKRYGKALLITGTTKVTSSSSSGASASGTAAKILAYGKSFLGRCLSPGFPWCAWYVSYKCCAHFGISTSVVPRTKSVSDLLAFARRHGRFHSRSSNYTPVPGDIFIYKERGHSHTGFVYQVSADGKRWRTLEGNASNRVAMHWHPRNYYLLTGFFHPSY